VSDWAFTLIVCVVLLLQLPLMLPPVVSDPPAPNVNVAVCALPNWIALALAVLGFSGRRAGWFYRSIALAIPTFEGLQIWLGQQAQTPWHVTLGVLIWAAALALLIKVWMPTWLAAPTPAT